MRFENILLLLLVVSGLAGCNSVFYHPHRDQYYNPSVEKKAYRELAVDTEDGKRLSAWHIQTQKPSKGVVVQFHGNAQNMTTHYRYVEWLTDFGYDVLTFDYRGYGNSDGKPSREGLVVDGQAVLKLVDTDAQFSKKDVFVIGQSLGGAVAVPSLAAYSPKNLRAVVLESAFHSYRWIARDKVAGAWLLWPFQWPLGFLVSDAHSLEDSIAAIQAPILVIHGDRDPVVPLSSGEKIYGMAKGYKEMWILKGAGHTPAFGDKKSPYRQKFLEYLEKTSKEKLKVSVKSRARLMGHY